VLFFLAALDAGFAFRKEGRPLQLLMAGLFAGFSVATRAQGALAFPLLLFICGLKPWRKKMLLFTAAALLIAILPFTIWLIIKSSAASSFDYLAVAKAKGINWSDLDERFVFYLQAPFNFLKLYSTTKGMRADFAIYWIIFPFYAFAMLAALGRFRREPLPAAAALTVILFAAMLPLWYYVYERFIIITIPLSAFVLASVLFPATIRHRVWLRTIGLLLFSTIYIIMATNYSVKLSTIHIRDMAKDRRHGFIKYQMVAGVVNKLNQHKSPVLISFEPHLAYHLDGHVYIDRSKKHYYASAFKAGKALDFIREKGIEYIIINSNLGKWMNRHRIPHWRNKKLFKEIKCPPDINCKQANIFHFLGQGKNRGRSKH